MAIPSIYSAAPVQKSPIIPLPYSDVQQSFPFLLIIGIFIILLPPIRREDNKSHCLKIMHWAQVSLSALLCRSICNRDHICSLFCLAGFFLCVKPNLQKPFCNQEIYCYHTIFSIRLQLLATSPLLHISFLFCT